METLKKEKKLPYISCILLQSIVYGLGNPLTKIGFESITALWCLAFRFSIAAVILLIFGGPRTISKLKAAKVSTWLPNSLCIASAYISCNLALSFTTATNVGFLMSLPVLFAPVLSVIALNRPYQLRSLPIQIMVVIGLYMLCCDGGTFTFGIGEVLSLVCALSVAGTLVLSERSLSDLDPISMAVAQTGVTAVICVAAALIFDDVSVLPGVDAKAWLVVLYLAVTCSCLAYILQNTALTGLSASAVSMLQCTQPILTAVFSYILLRETLSVKGMAGAALIVVCVIGENYLSMRSSRQTEIKAAQTGETEKPNALYEE